MSATPTVEELEAQRDREVDDAEEALVAQLEDGTPLGAVIDWLERELNLSPSKARQAVVRSLYSGALELTTDRRLVHPPSA